MFVRAALNGVLREALIAAALTGLMILLFLGSWRSTLVIVVSIPLAILVSIIVFSAMGQTLNTMTLGGLALAVGILVDDATVEIENTNRNLAMGKPVTRAILDGAQQIATPGLRLDALHLHRLRAGRLHHRRRAGTSSRRSPLAVVLAMLASYFLSRTVVPTMVQYLLPAEAHLHQPGPRRSTDGGRIWSVHQRFNRHFERFQGVYRGALDLGARAHGGSSSAASRRWSVLSLGIFPLLGMDFFPTVDAGQFRLHVRCPAGTRIEETEAPLRRGRGGDPRDDPGRRDPDDHRQHRHPRRRHQPGVQRRLDRVGGRRRDPRRARTRSITARRPATSRRLRTILRERFPDLVFFFQPADIVSQILNFGLPAPIDVQIIGRDPKNLEIARTWCVASPPIPGAVDVRLQQVVDAPTIDVDVDRRLARQLGFTERTSPRACSCRSRASRRSRRTTGST